MSDPLAQLTAALADRYTIERELGRGGMAVVYLARDLKHERQVALKVLRPELAATVGAERFLREIRIAAQLNHPHILGLHDSGEADDFLFFVMPYVEGESLRDKLSRERELPVTEAVRILRDVVDALAMAHSHGVVHRDIKPDNVMLSGRHALVADFGVAKALSQAKGPSDLTTAGVALGTPAYMSPEQAVADEQVDHRSDIYAVGALAYELLTGRPPFLGTSAQMVLSAHVADLPDPVTKYRDTVSPPLEHLVLRCLEKKPADRWQSAEELLSQLEALATPSGGMTPTATRPVATVDVGTRKRFVRSAAAALTVLVAVTLLVVVWLGPKILGPSTADADAELPRIVVLPFDNLGAPEDEYFADGIADELMSRIGRLSGLEVIARSRAIQYKNTEKTVNQIAAELDVDYLLEGTVRWSKPAGTESRVRVSPQLIRGTDETQMWAEIYDEPLSEVFTVQSDIAEQVVNAMGVVLGQGVREQLLAEKPTENLEAYEYYLQGEAGFREAFPNMSRRLRDALSPYERAIELDSGFALAYARLSMVHGGLYWGSHDETPERLSMQKAAADTALLLDPRLPEAHLALGYYHYTCCRDYEMARAEFEPAMEARPNDSMFLTMLGVTYKRSGNMERAAAIYTKAADLDPLAFGPNLEAASVHEYLREYDLAERYLDRLLLIVAEPWWVYIITARIQLARDGNADQARQVLEDAANRFEEWPFERLVAVAASDREFVAEPLALVRVVCNVADCRGVLTELPSDSGLVGIQRYHHARARLHEWLGEPESARIHFDSAVLALEELAEREPTEPQWHAGLSLAYAALGRSAAARSEIEQAIMLQPISVDAWQGHNWISLQPQISARIGDYDAAIEQLDRLLAMPSWVSVPFLRVDPIWDPLRENPRFQALLEQYGN